MVNALVSYLRIKTRDKKRLHSFLSTIYQTFIVPFATGYIKHMIWYTVKVRRREIKCLESYGFKSIRPYLSYSWRRGTELDKAYRRYYRAEYENNSIFIKVAVNDSTIRNEIIMAEHMRSLDIPFIMKTIKTDMVFNTNMQMLAISFADGLREFTPPQTEIEFERECSNFFVILEKLCQTKVVHADIHPKNLMLNKNNTFVLLDFGISGIIGNKNDVDYIARCGTFFYEKNGIRIYDDAYSFVKMIETMHLPDEWLNKPCFMQIKNRIGGNIIRVKLNTGRIIVGE